MGRTGADGTRVRFEYHPLNDSYHLLVSGPAVAKFAADALPMVVVSSGFDRHFFRGSNTCTTTSKRVASNSTSFLANEARMVVQ